MKPLVLILNGSPRGPQGNCHNLIKKIEYLLKPSAKTKVLHLSQASSETKFRNSIKKSSAVIFVTGTYWDSWGSPLQRLLENITDLEGSSQIMGQPCAVFVLKHSVGGKGVLSRLQGVLSTFGFLIPPMSGMVYSLVSDIALKSSKSPHLEDLWNPDDIARVLNHLLLSLTIDIDWTSWPVDQKNFRKIWLKS